MKWEYFLVVGLLVFGSVVKRTEPGRSPASVSTGSAMAEMAMSGGI